MDIVHINESLEVVQTIHAVVQVFAHPDIGMTVPVLVEIRQDEVELAQDPDWVKQRIRETLVDAARDDRVEFWVVPDPEDVNGAEE